MRPVEWARILLCASVRGAAICCLLLPSAGAQDGAPPAQDPTDSIPTQALALDFAVPDSPAFVALGVTPEKVNRPTSPRKFGAALLEGIDDQGSLQTGVAIEAVPYLVFFGSGLTLRDYRGNEIDNRLRRLLSRLNASLATTKGTDSDDKSLRLSLGFRATLWDEGDPRLDGQLSSCIATVHREAIESMRTFDVASENLLRERLAIPEDQDLFQTLPQRVDAMSEAEICAKLEDDGLCAGVLEDRRKRLTWEPRIESCFTASKNRHWNASALDVGIAPTWMSNDGSFNDLNGNGGVIWSSLALRVPEPKVDSPESSLLKTLHDRSQFVAHTRYRWDTDVSTGSEGVFVEQDDLLVGMRLRILPLPDTFSFFALSAEGAYTWQNPRGGKSADGQLYAVAAEFRLVEGVYLQISTGSNNPGGSRSGEGFVLGSVRYGFSNESSMDILSALQ